MYKEEITKITITCKHDKRGVRQLNIMVETSTIWIHLIIE